MTALFHPLHFTAHAGFVCFQGRPLSDLRVIALRRPLVRAALDAPIHSRAFGAFHTAHEQLEAAYDLAKAQRSVAA